MVTAAMKLKDMINLGRKAMINLDRVLKSRDITLLTKVLIVKAMVFPIVMYGCESWAIKKAELQRIDAFELWCWWRLLRVSWTARRSKQSILKEVNPEYSLKWLMMKLSFNILATWWEEWTHWKKTLMLEKIEGRRRKGWQRMRRLDGMISSTDISLSKLRKMVKDREAWQLQSTGSQRVRHDLATEQ